MIQKRWLFPGAADENGLPRPAEHTVNLREFRLNALYGAAGERHSQRAQLHPLLICQHAGGTAVAGELSFLRAQHDQMLLPVAAHGIHRAHLHCVQHRRDGAHVVLAQQQPQKPHKMLRLPGRIPQHRVHLLQSGNENFPQLIQNLSLSGLPLRLQFPGKIGEPFRKTDFLQKFVEPQNLLLQAGCLPEPIPQPDERVNRLRPGGIQSRQPGLGILIPHAAKAIRMTCPVFRPCLPPQSPGDGVVFHPVTGVHIQGRQGRTQISQHVPELKAPYRRFQSGNHRGDDTGSQDFLVAGAVQRNVKPVEHQIHKGLIGPHVRAHHRNVPVPGTLRRQFTNPVRRQQALGVNTAPADNLQAPLCLAFRNTSLKQPFPHRVQAVLPRFGSLHGNGNPRPFGGVIQ